eukprot:15027-Heterococcus_DN1.PRE.1
MKQAQCYNDQCRLVYELNMVTYLDSVPFHFETAAPLLLQVLYFFALQHLVSLHDGTQVSAVKAADYIAILIQHDLPVHTNRLRVHTGQAGPACYAGCFCTAANWALGPAILQSSNSSAAAACSLESVLPDLNWKLLFRSKAASRSATRPRAGVAAAAGGS